MNYMYEAEKQRNERSDMLTKSTKDDQFKQFQEKIKEKARYKEEKMKEGKVVMQLDKEYQEKQSLRHIEKKKEQLKIREALDESMKYTEQNRQQEVQQETEEEQRFQKWRNQKQKQDEIRKQKEEEYKKYRAKLS